MKVLVVFGSPRKKGNTAQLLFPFVDELTKSGADVDVVDVYEKHIAGCRVCLRCQKEEHIYCVIDDDMQPLLKKVEACDLIVFAAPVYCWSLPAPVKAVLDRIIYASCRYYGGNPYGPSLLENKRLALLTTCGYPEEKGVDLLVEALKRTAKHCRLTYAGEIVCRQRNFKEPFMNEEKEQAARTFARTLLG